MTEPFSSRNPSALPIVSGTRDPSWHHLLHRIGRDLMTLGGLATVCACVGLTLNQLRDEPLPLFYVPVKTRLQAAVTRLDANGSQMTTVTAPGALPTNAPIQDQSPRIIDLEEFRGLVQTKEGVVLDARPEIFYRLGHVPGALSLSRDEFERDYARQRALLEPMRNQAIAVYCSSVSCEDSKMVADTLTKLGYRHILVFKGGWEEWTRAGLPEEHQ